MPTSFRLQLNRVPLFALTCLALMAFATTGWAKRAPDRSNLSATIRALSAPDVVAEQLAPSKTSGGVQRQLGAGTGLLRRYYLREPAQQPSSTEAPRAIADRFLRDHAAELGLAVDAPARDLELTAEQESPSGTHFRWRQQLNGVPVYRGDLVLKVSKRGQVSSVQNNLRPGLTVSTVASVTKEQALEKAIATIQPTGKALGNFKTELQIVDAGRGPQLAYLVDVPVEAPMGDWRAFVDAKSGVIFGLEDRMTYATGTGRVFDPDPMSKTGDSTLVDNNDADSAVPFATAYDIKTLQGITFSAGIYSLSGPYVQIIDDESPTQAPVTATQPDSFRFQRNAQGFEDVNVYYQLDASQRYIQGLGFANINNRVQPADTHGLGGADNSHYVPSTGHLAFGEGGVDDDEDLDVIWHEYGHSIQDNQVPGWGGGQEGAMGEGFGDYWAGSASLALFPNFQPNFVFTWDGHNAFWPGRVLIDPSLHYPEDCCGEVHDSGTLWCSGLIDTWHSLGRTVMDRLVLDHHFGLGTSATMEDAANQLIQSDIDLYGGAHVQTLVTKLGFWGFVDPADFVPTITHTPLSDTENTTGPYPVVATITSVQPLVADSLRVYWGVGTLSNSLLMTPTANPNEYSASIPGPLSNVDVRYYIRATDTNGGASTHPAGAPTSFHTFHVGADVTPPVITHNPIGNYPAIQWPATVQATVTDNLGVRPDSVRVDWTLNATPKQTFYLVRIGSSDNYSRAFPGVAADVNPGDNITYHITAQDIASSTNFARHPAVGEHSFQIIAALGVVLVLDDDEVAKRPTVKMIPGDGDKIADHVVTETGGGGVGISSANVIAGMLNSFGYVATVEAANTSNPATWPTYSFIVSASGSNVGPVANAAYRTALENYVAAGKKLLVEGGEVVYDAASTPGYPSFATNVLHASNWATDNAGSLQKLAAQTGHPIANLPNVLPATIPITYTGFGSEDSYRAIAPAYIVYGVTTQPGNGGLLVYDNNVAPQSAQIVVFGFNLKETGDLATRTNLLQNTARFLLAAEGAATASISGHVSTGTILNGTGVSVTLTPTAAATTTNASGDYSFPNLFASTYTVTASKPGYTTESRNNVVVAEGAAVTNVNLHLYPLLADSVCVSPAAAIPDNNPTGATSVINLADAFAVSTVQVYVNITHTYIGDLALELRHGAKTVRLHNHTGGSADNIVGTYPPRPVDGPGALADFTGDPAAGAWTLFAVDNANQDVGVINQWCIRVTGADSSGTVGVGPGASLPSAAMLFASHPNPLQSGSATIRYAVPKAQHAQLEVFDITGRAVRSLVNGTVEAGEHVATWDGRDARGRRASPGVYLVRMRTMGYEATNRMVVVH